MVVNFFFCFVNSLVLFVHRRLFHICTFFLFFFNIFLGVVSCLKRILIGAILGVMFLGRTQKSVLSRDFELKDPGLCRTFFLIYPKKYKWFSIIFNWHCADCGLQWYCNQHVSYKIFTPHTYRHYNESITGVHIKFRLSTGNDYFVLSCLFFLPGGGGGRLVRLSSWHCSFSRKR